MRSVAVTWGGRCRLGGLTTHLWANGQLGRVIGVDNIHENIPRLRVALTPGQLITCDPGRALPIPEDGPYTAIQPPSWSLMESHLLRLRLAWLVEGLTRPGGPPSPAWERRALPVGPSTWLGESPAFAPHTGGQVAIWISQQVSRGRLTPALATASYMGAVDTTNGLRGA